MIGKIGGPLSRSELCRSLRTPEGWVEGWRWQIGSIHRGCKVLLPGPSADSCCWWRAGFWGPDLVQDCFPLWESLLGAVCQGQTLLSSGHGTVWCPVLQVYVASFLCKELCRQVTQFCNLLWVLGQVSASLCASVTSPLKWGWWQDCCEDWMNMCPVLGWDSAALREHCLVQPLCTSKPPNCPATWLFDSPFTVEETGSQKLNNSPGPDLP